MSELIQLESLPVEALAEMANEAAAACEASGRKTVEHAATCGRALLAIRPQIPHGEWMDWLKDNFSQSQVRAHQYMEIANYNRGYNLEDATSIRQALRLIAESPEKQVKKAEREARKAEAPPKSLAPAAPASPVSPGVIRHENPPSQPQKPAWLADPDELERPEADDLPPLPRTNTHHTPDNRRTPDARATDLASVAAAEEPFRHGGWYEWSEPRQRMIPIDDYAICSRAEEINPPPPELPAVLARHNADDILRVMLETRDARREKPEQVLRLLKKIVGQLQDPEGAVVTAIATPDEPKPGKLPTLSQLRKAIDTQAGWGEALRQAANDWAAYKMSLSGKEKVRSMDSWKKALVRMGNVAKSQSVSVVCEAIEKAIANGWTGWEHLDKLKHSPAQLRTQAAGTEDFGIEYEVVE